MSFRISSLLICGIVFMLAVGAATAATMIDGKPNNPYGVMLSLSGDDHSDYASVHFQWASDLIGEWGHVRVNSGIHSTNPESGIRTLAICRAKKLIPVMTGLHVPEEYRIPGGSDAAPYVRDDGYPKAAQHYGAWAKRLTDLGAVVPYYEVGNEINGKWKPEAYGRFIIAISRALKDAMPGVKVVGAGLAGSGADFVDGMLAAVPESAASLDCWGLHPYGANHPPAYMQDDCCLRAHLWTAAALAKHGVDSPRFVMTESGYELRNKRDERYPRITDELRARYLVEAYETVWVPDPRVVTLCIFMLQSANFPGWDGWILIDTDCKLSETYKALAAVPKPPGSDWMPSGDCSIEGRITDATTGQGLERVFIYTVPGVYAAETDADGSYRIDGVPAGTYQTRIFRDGFETPAPGSVSLSQGASAKWNTTMARVGLITNGMDSGEKIANGWLCTDGQPDEHYAVDTQVKRNGAASQRLTARPGSPPSVWICTNYATALPDRHYAAEVWVTGKGVRVGDGKGVTLKLAVTDSGAQPFSEAEVSVPLQGDFDWTPVSVTIAPYAPGRRLTVTCGLEAEAGTVWFDDPYCHYAQYPVSSRLSMADGKGSVVGAVEADEGEFMMDAVVCALPGNFWTTTRSDGSYTLEGLPAGVYDLYAFQRGKVSIPARGVRVATAPVDVDLQVRKPGAPREVGNPGFEERGPNSDYTPGWVRYGEFDGIPLNGWHKGIPDHPEGVSSFAGEAFAGSASSSNVKNGGLYQIIAVDRNKCYEVSVKSYTYQTEEGSRGDVANRLGLDPTGGTDPNGPYVLWTPYTPSHRTWSTLTQRAAPSSDRMTIFLEAQQVHGLAFNVNCFDDVTLSECEAPLPAHQYVTDSIPAAHGSGPSVVRRDAPQPPFLWTFTAPGSEPWRLGDGADDVGPPSELRRKWMKESGMTMWGVRTGWADAEPRRLPDGAVEKDFDWTAFDAILAEIPPRMAAQCRFELNAPWAEDLMESDEDEYWRLAERFMEFAARRAHAAGVRYYRVPGNEMSLTMRPDWAELYMKPVRHYANAIHRGHPDNQVIAGALVVGDRGHINALYGAGFKEHCDILDIHAYANGPGEWRYNVGLSQIVESHKVLEENGDGHKRIFLGEGWSVFPLPKHLDHIKEPPQYTEEDFEHYRRAVAFGYAALTTPREGYDPKWLIGASFFCLNDLWGSMGWAKRATIERDEHGEPAFWLLDGYKFPYEPNAMDPQFRAWGLIDIEGNPKGDTVVRFPPYIPRTRIISEIEPGQVVPGVPRRARISITNLEPEPLTDLQFEMLIFKGSRAGVVPTPVESAIPDKLEQGQTAVAEFDLVVMPDQAGKQIWLQGGCEFKWTGESHYTDGWLQFPVDSPGSFTTDTPSALAASTSSPISLVFRLDETTDTPLPDRLDLRADKAVTLEQRAVDEGSRTRRYEVTVTKVDASAGWAGTVFAGAGGSFPEMQSAIAFPRPGRVPQESPARGKLINAGFEHFGPGSGYEAWDGPPTNWDEPDFAADLPDSGERFIMKAYCGTKYAHENSQVVLVPDGFRAGATVTSSVWCLGLAQAEATNHDALRFRISVEFLDSPGGNVIRRDDSPILRGSAKWEKLVFTTKGAPEGVRAIRLILMHENTDYDSWHKAAMDNVTLTFGKAAGR